MTATLEAPASQHIGDTHTRRAGGSKLDADHPVDDTQLSPVGVDQSRSAAASPAATPRPVSLSLVDPLLSILAESVDDIEALRKATANRLGHLTRGEPDSDGDIRGLGMDPGDPGVVEQSALLDGITQLEAGAIKTLEKRLRKHPLGPWIKRQQGLGDKQTGRLLAAIGDPYWNFLHDRPRTVSELWAYCGLHVVPVGQPYRDTHALIAGGAQSSGGGGMGHSQRDTQDDSVRVAPARTRGQKSNWNDTARMRTWNVAGSCVKQRAGTPYRDIYAAGRTKYAHAVHAVECRRCGPKGKPALAGSPLSDGHKHARATRLVMKAVLKDLWVEARRIHLNADGGGAA